MEVFKMKSIVPRYNKSAKTNDEFKNITYDDDEFPYKKHGLYTHRFSHNT
jgi:hypothetical protein